MKTKICFYILLAAFGAVSTVQAGTKEELIRLQNEVKIIQRQFQEFSESYNEHLGAVHSLVIQLNDEIARTNSTLSRMGVALNSRTEDARGQETSLLGEIRELSEKIDNAAIGITVLAQQFNDYKLQASMRPGAASSLSAETMFNQAMRDYMQEDFDMAIEGFTIYVDSYPAGESAARALLYIGDSYSSLNRLKEASDAFSRVINEYPQVAVVPSALYKRGRIETVLDARENAIADFRDIIERFPTAIEADLAKSELQLLESTQKPKTGAKTGAKATTAPKATTPGRR